MCLPKIQDYLILQIVYELAVLAVFARQDFLELENRCVDRDCSVLLENLRDGVEDKLAQRHGGRRMIPCSL
jgi:hypothetical protein